MQKYTVRKHESGFYRVMWGQQTDIDVAEKLTLKEAKKIATFRNETSDSGGFYCGRDDDFLENDELISRIRSNNHNQIG